MSEMNDGVTSAIVGDAALRVLSLESQVQHDKFENMVLNVHRNHKAY